MTGFCKAEVTYKNLVCNVEIRSVNHRFFDCRVSIPRQHQYLDETLKKQLKQSITRGKVDLVLTLDGENEESLKLNIDEKLLDSFIAVTKRAEKAMEREIPVTMSDLLNVKGLITSDPEEEAPEDYEALFKLAVEESVKGLLNMRGREGELLQKEIMTHVDIMRELIEKIPQFKDGVLENYKQKLQKNIENLSVEFDEDNPRVMQEIGFFLDRSDVTEEVERFRTHLTHLQELLTQDEPVGRKLDFLMQELNREANTLCSKSCSPEMTAIGVDLKCEIEKIREQIQNIE